MKVAVVGAGWAGLACAVHAVRAGHQVVLFEAARMPGGRARRVETGDGLALDNGQHILIGAYSEYDPSSGAHGAWGNRVVLQGTNGTVVVSDLDFRNAFGFPSHGFTIVAVNR